MKTSSLFRLALLSLLVLWAGPVFGKVYLTKGEALKHAFPAPTDIVRENLFLGEEEVKRIETLSRSKVESRLFTYYRAMEKGKIIGYAYIGTHVVRTKPEIYMVVINPDGSARYVEILAFYEPEEYLPVKRWFDQFINRKLDDTLWPRRGIHAVTGATMSVNGITREVRMVLAVFELMIIERDGR